MRYYLASVEVDQRQNLILQSDKLREMLGASRLIEKTVEIAEDLLKTHENIKPVTLVSGVLRFTALDLQTLATFLWQLRLKIVEELHLPSTFSVVTAEEKFKRSVDRLEEHVRTNKDARTSETARPTSPLFAQCLIQPNLSANYWNHTKWTSDEPRRSLLSHESLEREGESNNTFSNQFSEFKALKNFSSIHKTSLWNALPAEFSHLATAADDSYIAFVKADGDSMGRLLMKVNWDELIARVEGSKACLQFSQAVESCLNLATTRAVDAVTGEWQFRGEEYNQKRFPVAPLVRAGEDYWIVCRRDLAFPLAIALGREYAELAATTTPLKESLGQIDELKDEKLTLSFGILFAKQGFPFEAQLHMAEGLIKSAKKFRKTHFASAVNGEKTGCLDYYWLESSAREEIISYRETALTVTDGNHHFRLFTAPWTLRETEQFLDAARSLAGSELASRKLKQLETILRLGEDFAQLAFEQWRQMLQPGEWEKFSDAIGKLPARLGIEIEILASNPFQRGSNLTPLLDLIKIVEIQNIA